MGAKKTEMIDLNRAIVVRTAGGEICRIKSKVALSESDGSMVMIIKPNTNKGTPAVYIPTAPGIKAISAKLGLAFDYPDTIIVDGVEQPNGYKDKEGTFYYVARVGGYTENGQPVIVQRMVDFNVRRYNIQDLLAKAKWSGNSQHFKVRPYMGVAKTEEGGDRHLGAPGDEWASYQIDDSVVLWVNCEAPDYVKWLGEMNNRIKNASRICQTFAERNAITAHPAFPIKRKFAHNAATVDCTAWIAKKGTINMDDLAKGSEVVIDAAAISVVDDEDAVAVVRADEAAEANDPMDASAVEAQQEVAQRDDADDDLDYTTPPAEEKKPAKKTKTAPEPVHPQVEGLVLNIQEMAKSSPVSFKKACEVQGVNPDMLMDAEVADLLEIQTLLKAAIGNVGR